jgi:2-polyprenyl-6-methoxyphenol hydroxylase-like FAD-dependent oxidoreductase
MSATRVPVLVVGAGIAGLATALGLRARGVECLVAESAREIVPLGVGINVLPHGVRVLAELGLAEALAGVAVETRAVEYRTRDGRLIHSDPRGRHAGMPFPQLSIHRGNLHAVLYRSLLERHGAGAVRTGARLIGLERRGDFVHAVFEDRRQGGTWRVDAEALVGADGILSAVRAALRPGEGPPRGSGILMYRGLTWAKPMLDGRTMVVAGVHERKAVLYPVRPVRRDGLQLLNWVAEIGERFGADAAVGDWNRPVERDAAASLFEDMRFDFADVPALVRASEVCLSYPMADRDPIDAWVDGRVALIGDAAHPMYRSVPTARRTRCSTPRRSRSASPRSRATCPPRCSRSSRVGSLTRTRWCWRTAGADLSSCCSSPTRGSRPAPCPRASRCLTRRRSTR